MNKSYYPKFKEALRALDTSINESDTSSYMNEVTLAIPYIQYTNPGIMAIARYLRSKGGDTFDRQLALQCITMLSWPGTNTDNLILDVFKGWERLGE